MREVTKSEFRRAYFTHGGGRDGWDEAYWKRFFEDDVREGMRFMSEEPATRQHSTMMIVSDFGENEYRLFFLTDEDADSCLEFPGEDT